MLKYYDLDKQTILEEESKRIEDITKKTINFFEKYNIKDERMQFRFLNNSLNLDYNRVESMLKVEEDFHKILLLLSINHPNQYPDYISFKDFSNTYNIKENALTYYIDQIVENNIYPIKFFKIMVAPNKYYFFQENERLEIILRAITEDHIKEFTYLNKLFTRTSSINTTLNNILEELCKTLFHSDLKESLREFLPAYINFLAYKLETKGELKETYDKLEGIIWQNISEALLTKDFKEIENQHRGISKIDKEISLEPNKIDLYYSKVKILLKFSQYEKIFKLLTNMVQIFPEHEKDIKIIEAYIYKRMQNINAGLEIINNLLQKYPKDYDLLSYKAYWLQYLNKEDEALKIIRDVTKDAPENNIYRDTYGEILMYFEMYEEAIEQFQKVIEFAGDEWYLNQSFIKLGICYNELKNYELAVKYLKKGKELTTKASIDRDTIQKWDKIASLFLAMIEDIK
jgi:tetratricopeptide (TPR) repeat protein